jgi:uncharacterized alpha-E superfamily protein
MRSQISRETWEQIKTAYASGIGLREIARNANNGTHQIQTAKAEGRARFGFV